MPERFVAREVPYHAWSSFFWAVSCGGQGHACGTAAQFVRGGGDGPCQRPVSRRRIKRSHRRQWRGGWTNRLARANGEVGHKMPTTCRTPATTAAFRRDTLLQFIAHDMVDSVISFNVHTPTSFPVRATDGRNPSVSRRSMAMGRTSVRKPTNTPATSRYGGSFRAPGCGWGACR